jgi:hypothetical protein
MGGTRAVPAAAWSLSGSFPDGNWFEPLNRCLSVAVPSTGRLAYGAIRASGTRLSIALSAVQRFLVLRYGDSLFLIEE